MLLGRSTHLSAPVPLAASRRAHQGLALVLLLLVLAVGVGANWDRLWHLTHVFDGFFSPPHLFVYSMVVALALVGLALMGAPGLRQAFVGPQVRLPGLPVAVPGALLLPAGGLVLVALAGALDAGWHTAWGLDETGWSTPHAMLGWGIALIGLGWTAARRALRPARPLPAYTTVGLALVALWFTAGPLLGPFQDNSTPAHLQAVGHLPILAAQPPFMHTLHIYQQWHLDRTNPIFIPLMAVWMGLALALARRLAGQPGAWLLALTLWTLLAALSDSGSARALAAYVPAANTPAAWLPLPMLPAALAFGLLHRLRVREPWAWAGAGLVAGVLSVLTWDTGQGAAGLLLVVLAAGLVPLGARLGTWLAVTLDAPTAPRLRLLLAVAFCAPLLTGLLDFALRANTPW